MNVKLNRVLTLFVVSIMIVGAVAAFTGGAAAQSIGNGNAVITADDADSGASATYTIRLSADTADLSAIDGSGNSDGGEIEIVFNDDSVFDDTAVTDTDLSSESEIEVFDTDGTNFNPSTVDVQTPKSDTLTLEFSDASSSDNFNSDGIVTIQIGGNGVITNPSSSSTSVDVRIDETGEATDGNADDDIEGVTLGFDDQAVAQATIDGTVENFSTVSDALSAVSNNGDTVTVKNDADVADDPAGVVHTTPIVTNDNVVIDGGGNAIDIDQSNLAASFGSDDAPIEISGDNATVTDLTIRASDGDLRAVRTTSTVQDIDISNNTFDSFQTSSNGGTIDLDSNDVDGTVTIDNNAFNDIDPNNQNIIDVADNGELDLSIQGNSFDGDLNVGNNDDQVIAVSPTTGNQHVLNVSNNTVASGANLDSGNPAVIDIQSTASAAETINVSENNIEGMSAGGSDSLITINPGDTDVNKVLVNNNSIDFDGQYSHTGGEALEITGVVAGPVNVTADGAEIGGNTAGDAVSIDAGSGSTVNLSGLKVNSVNEGIIVQDGQIIKADGVNVTDSNTDYGLELASGNADTIDVVNSELKSISSGDGIHISSAASAAALTVDNITADDVTSGPAIHLDSSNLRDPQVTNLNFTKLAAIGVDVNAADSTGTVNVTGVEASGADAGTVVEINADANGAIVDDVNADNVTQILDTDGFDGSGETLDVTNIVGDDLEDGSEAIRIGQDTADADGARTITVESVNLDQIGNSDGVAIVKAEEDPSTNVVLRNVVVNSTDRRAVDITTGNGDAGAEYNRFTIEDSTFENVTGADEGGQAVHVNPNGIVTTTTINNITAVNNSVSAIEVDNLNDNSDSITISNVEIEEDSANNNGIGIGANAQLESNTIDISDVDANNTNIGINLAAFEGTQNPSVTVGNVKVTNASTDALVVADNAIDTVNVTNSEFADNQDGVVDNADVNLNVNNNQFFAHNGNAFDGNTGPAANVNISFNYWNSTTGPTVIGGNNRYSLGTTIDISGYGTPTDITELPFTTESGEVVRAATGQLQDPSGNGIADQEVTFSLTDVDTGNNKTVTFSELSNSNDAGTSQDGDYVIAAETGTTDFVTFDVTASTAGFAETDTNRFTLGNDEFLTTGFDLQANDAAQINGTATGPSGDALTNTQLQVLDAASGDQLATATTDSDGVFTFDVSPLSSDTVFINDTAGTFPDSSEATVSVDTGEQVDQSFTLGGQLNGTVFFPNETATDNTEIDFTVNNGAETVVSTTTDENGSYTVDITAREGSDGARDYTLQAENSSFDPSDATDVTITEGEVTTQNFTLKSLNTATLTATIQNGTSGEALTDTEVTLTAGDNAPGSLNATRTTDSNGQITLRIPASDPPTAYDITANADGFSSASVGFAPSPGESVSRTFSLEADQQDQEQPPTATVTFGENDALTVQNGSTSVNVASATFNGSEAFNIVVHQASDDNDDGTIQASEIGQKIGESVELDNGTQTDIPVNISKQVADNDNVSQLTENQTLVAMLHTTNTSDNDNIVHTASIKRDGTRVFDQAEITIAPESPLEGPAGEFDSNGDGDITITELGQAGLAFTNGELTIEELGEIALEFTS